MGTDRTSPSPDDSRDDTPGTVTLESELLRLNVPEEDEELEVVLVALGEEHPAVKRLRAAAKAVCLAPVVYSWTEYTSVLSGLDRAALREAWRNL